MYIKTEDLERNGRQKRGDCFERKVQCACVHIWVGECVYTHTMNTLMYSCAPRQEKSKTALAHLSAQHISHSYIINKGSIRGAI